MADLADTALAVFAISTGLGVAALALYVADLRERRKWQRAARRIPFITE